MLVKDKHLTTIWYEKKTDKVKIIDQRLIPFELKIIELNTVDEVCFAIKEMQVRGAPLIGVTAAFGMYIASKKNSNLDFLQEASKKINATRPTAVNLSCGLAIGGGTTGTSARAGRTPAVMIPCHGEEFIVGIGRGRRRGGEGIVISVRHCSFWLAVRTGGGGRKLQSARLSMAKIRAKCLLSSYRHLRASATTTERDR